MVKLVLHDDYGLTLSIDDIIVGEESTAGLTYPPHSCPFSHSHFFIHRPFDVPVPMVRVFCHNSCHLFFTVRDSRKSGYLNRVSSVSLLLPPRRSSPTKGYLS